MLRTAGDLSRWMVPVFGGDGVLSGGKRFTVSAAVVGHSEAEIATSAAGAFDLAICLTVVPSSRRWCQLRR